MPRLLDKTKVIFIRINMDTDEATRTDLSWSEVKEGIREAFRLAEAGETRMDSPFFDFPVLEMDSKAASLIKMIASDLQKLDRVCVMIHPSSDTCYTFASIN